MKELANKIITSNELPSGYNWAGLREDIELILTQKNDWRDLAAQLALKLLSNPEGDNATKKLLADWNDLTKRYARD